MILKWKDINLLLQKFFLPEDVHIKNVLVTDKKFCGKKVTNTLLVIYAMVVNVNYYKINIMLPKANTFVKGFYGQTNWMYFLIEGNVLLNKYNNIWDRVGSNIQ